ncbi:SAM-dependent methyltransferase [Pigmentiphaga aceris]|nr:class I SAM-dependent methyltransferase [Pigmentiphaga aceris]
MNIQALISIDELTVIDGPLGQDAGTLVLFASLGRFKARMREACQVLLRRADPVTQENCRLRMAPAFRALTEGFDAWSRCDMPATLRHEVGALMQREMLPYLLMTEVAERFYAKPRGYAGDYLTIDMIYRNQPGGYGRLGPLIDACFLDEPAARAVRNRRALMAAEILHVLDARPDARICSLACGPAYEIRDIFSAYPNVPARFTAIDSDREALDFVNRWVAKAGVETRLSTLRGNLVYLAIGRDTLPLVPQDFIYSIGLIDYFSDKLVIGLLDWIHASLKPGGRVLLGNFHPQNVNRAFMDHVLEWRLIHRGEADMDRLFQASSFARPATRVFMEDEGVNLFAECIKN